MESKFNFGLAFKTEAPVHQRDGYSTEYGHIPPGKRAPVVVADVFFVGEPGGELAGGIADIFPHEQKT